LPLAGDAHQLVLFERMQVIVHLLPRETEPPRERRRGPRRRQLGEQAVSDGIQRDGGGGGIVDDVDIEHASKLALTKNIVNPH
jgi:hypothetical protein